MTADTTMTDVDTSPEPEIYALARELVEHWEVQGAAAKKNGDNEVAAQFGMMSRVVKSLYHEARRKSSRCDELERLAGKIIEAWQTIEAQCSDGDGFTHKAHTDMHDAIDALEAHKRKGE